MARFGSSGVLVSYRQQTLRPDSFESFFSLSFLFLSSFFLENLPKAWFQLRLLFMANTYCAIGVSTGYSLRIEARISYALYAL